MQSLILLQENEVNLFWSSVMIQSLQLAMNYEVTLTHLLRKSKGDGERGKKSPHHKLQCV